MVFGQGKIEYKTPSQLQRMVEAGQVTAALLDAAMEAAVPGASTEEINQVAQSVIEYHGAKSNFLGYYGFPAVICTSINDEIVHGIPSDKRILQEGDLLSIDGGAIVEGYHGDSARTKIIGRDNSRRRKEDQTLNQVTYDSLWAGIAAMATGKYLGDVSNAIEGSIRNEENGDFYGILEDFVGHGIGTKMHQPPDVFNFSTGKKGSRLKPGMCLAIEPMVTHGDIHTKTLDDEWTVITADRTRAAHWEHSVALHEDGIWVLTAPDGGAEELKKYGIDPVPPLNR